MQHFWQAIFPIIVEFVRLNSKKFLIYWEINLHNNGVTEKKLCTKSCYILSIVMWIWNNFLHFRSLYDIPNRIFQSIWVICPNLYTCLKSLAYNTPSTQITLIKINISLAYNFPSIDTAWIESACQGHYDLDNKPSLYFSYDFQFNLIKSFGLNCFVSHKKNRLDTWHEKEIFISKRSYGQSPLIWHGLTYTCPISDINQCSVVTGLKLLSYYTKLFAKNCIP